MTTDAPSCQGCLKNIEQGEVVAFGQSLFHVECFICAKCKQCVDNKNNLLVLNDGKPLCAGCSYNCAKCQQVIHDEAILTGDQAYHSDCFKCSSCNMLIKDLIFTQTAKGIYCTLCNKQTLFSSGSNNKLSITTNELENSNDSFFSDLTTLSFFDNDSSDLSNLSNSLGANILLNNENKSTVITQSRLNRASEILEKSLRTTSIILTNDSRNKQQMSTLDITRLKQELLDSQSKLKEMESSYKTLQEASQQALDEFNKIKEDYAREANVKQQMEYSIVALLKKNGSILSRKELDKLALFRMELEQTCKEMISYRDKIATSIDQSIDNSSIYQKNLKTQIKSLLQERELLNVQNKELSSTRDEILHDLVILVAKNTELTNMNNDLSKLAFEKEQMANEPHHSPPLSPSQSTELKRNAETGSIYNFKLDHQPNLARTIKKKGSTMFSKLKKPEQATLAPSSASLYRTPSQQSVTNLECQHSFQSTSFLRPVKCGVCSDKIWGRSEYRCDHCGFATHARCLYSSSSLDVVDLSSSPSSSQSSDVDIPKKAAMDLIQRCELENRTVPLLVEECLKEVEKRGLDYEGIYRKSGGAAQIRTIQQAYDHGDVVNLSDQEEFNDICAITSVLKQYFRDLSVPLLTHDHYQKFIEYSVLKNDEEKIQQFSNVLSQLPKAHLDTASVLFKHLYKVYQRSDQNRMTAKNLAMVFAPTLMRHIDPSRDFLDISYKNATIEYILLHTEQLFPTTL